MCGRVWWWLLHLPFSHCYSRRNLQFWTNDSARQSRHWAIQTWSLSITTPWLNCPVVGTLSSAFEQGTLFYQVLPACTRETFYILRGNCATMLSPKNGVPVHLRDPSPLLVQYVNSSADAACCFQVTWLWQLHFFPSVKSFQHLLSHLCIPSVPYTASLVNILCNDCTMCEIYNSC